MTGRDAATERQVQAARPDASTWLEANAGSGKTRVLTDRVARLLLQGVQPQNILCLTYTKAAASEMQNRLFDRLGEWAMQPDHTLAAQLQHLGADTDTSPQRMRHARTLFARAIEAPGGLKIQTIHSFCASILRRFPLEAGVSPEFTEMEDRAARLLRAEILQDLSDGPDGGIIGEVAAYIQDSGFETLMQAILSRRESFAAPLDSAAIWRLFDLPPGFGIADLERSVFLGSEPALLTSLIAALRSGGSQDQTAAKRLSGLSGLDSSAIPQLEKVFLSGKTAKSPFSAKIGAFPTKAVRQNNAGLMPELEQFMQRIEDGRRLRIALLAATKTDVLHRFAGLFLREYDRRKQIRGWLDFDDQILRARALLRNPEVAAWVLFRLDGGIDHILVDEAQDTSPEQWDVIEALAREFTAGKSARGDVERTIFVVGDKKQSIYSFQGADPDGFDRMRDEFSGRLAGVGSNLWNLNLEYSFRSAQVILDLVDVCFMGRETSGFPRESLHRAFKDDLPGRIDLWPPVPTAETAEPSKWTDPVDLPSPRHHHVVLAERIAAEIKRLIDSGATIPTGKKGELTRRPVRGGDFLILVQRRSLLFAEIIRACKQAGLPIAGADRLKVGAELAVRDLIALLKFLATPEDDLSLATCLKSPLFGWGEQALYSLAQGRNGTFLWKALRDAADHAETAKVLVDLMDNTDFLRPYDLIERVLNRHDGRRLLVGRLGEEAEDGIDALLSQALAYERTEIPSLTGFLTWAEADDLEIKRQIGGSGDLIRVMTVHGAKGLEAPIVILPDTAPRPYRIRTEVLTLNDSPVWRPLSDDVPDLLQESLDGIKSREESERLRLLYVALTRAETWLIVAVAGNLSKTGESWYQIVEAGMKARNARPQEMPGGEGLSLIAPQWDALPVAQHTRPADPDPIAVPAFYGSPAPEVAPLPDTISPSGLGGSKVLIGNGGEDEATAKRRGTAIHLLLEHLPSTGRQNWTDLSDTLLQDWDAAERAPIVNEAVQVLDAPDLAFAFAHDTLAEVPLTADFGANRLSGIVDRLIVAPDHVLAVDFKSNAVVPERAEDCPDGLLYQMGAYAHALGQIFPDRRIDTAIIWTRTARLMRLPHDLVSSRVEATQHLDADDKAP